MRRLSLNAALTLTLLLAAPLVVASQDSQTAPQASQLGADLPYPPIQQPTPDEIEHVPTGLKMSFDGMMDMVAGARLVCVGETHDSLQAHRAELQIIRDLYRRFPDKIAIGMEMFRQPQQPTLDRWTRGELNELQFLEAVDWQKTWGIDFGYYRAILDFARDHHIDVIALNPPADLQEEVRQHGLDALSDEVRSRLPDIGPPDPYERAAMKALYGAHLPTAGAFDAFFRVQLLWEESMAARAVDYLKSARGEGKTLVTLTGGWHVHYGFGVPKKIVRRMPLSYVIIEPTEIDTPPEKQMPGVDLPQIPLLPSDFVWWVRYEDLSASGVHLGVELDDKIGGLVVRSITKGSPAEKSGLLVGDEITAVAGHAVTNLTGLVYWIGQQKKGTNTTITLRRAGALLNVRTEF